MADGTAQVRGADLERRIEQYLTLHGYACRRNAVVEGRSGGRHEVDVLAERSDGVTDFRLAVECKAHRLPVDKDAVAKLAYVVGDLGLHKGIVASLAGSRLGAEQSAAELGIELWGPAELAVRLGQVALAELAAAPAGPTGDALPLRCPPAAALDLVRGQRRGWLGPGRERIEWIRLVWIPHHLLAMAVAGPARRRRGDRQATWRWNLYDAVTGSWAGSLAAPPDTVEEVVSPALPEMVSAGKLAAAVRRAVQRRDEVVTRSARDRYAERLEALGLPGDAETITIDEVRLLHHPFHLALLQSGTGARLVAVDAHRGAISPLGPALTGVIGSVLRSLA
jgi:Restriction endonuclease